MKQDKRFEEEIKMQILEIIEYSKSIQEFYNTLELQEWMVSLYKFTL